MIINLENVDLDKVRAEARENLRKSLEQINQTKFCGPGKFYDPKSDMRRDINSSMFEYIR